MSSKKKTTRQNILDISSELFMDKGFQATSTRQIAERAGITQPNLYYHFKTKEAIYIAVLEDLSKVVKEQLQLIIHEENQPLEEKLLQVIRFLKEKHPVNLFLMRHDIDLITQYIKDDALFNAVELAMHFYGNISPYIQKSEGNHETLRPDQLVHLFVYGIIDRKDT